MDFCNDANSVIIPYKLVKVLPGEYLIDGEYMWAQPDLEVAKNQMLNIYTNKDYYKKISKNAKESAEFFFNEDRFSCILKDCLKDALEKNI
jgi:hypothetical protein